jgi:hypothetical protein
LNNNYNLKIEKMNKLLFEALRAKYIADQLDALAILSVYGNNSVGIGEHPQITEEMDKLVQQYVDAGDKIEAISEIVKKLSQ